jgi:beta-galactosidase
MRSASITLFLIMLILNGCNSPYTGKKPAPSLTREDFVPPMNTDRTRLFDSGWKFCKGEMTGAEDPGFNDDAWRNLDLPHDWSIEDLPGQKPDEIVGPFDKKSIGIFYTGYTDGGTGWYRKKFILPETDTGKEVSLYFDGVYMTADVWLNGHCLGTHKHGYTPFNFSLSKFLNSPGKPNVIAVQVKNIGENSRWYSGSGIYRHVWLRVTDKLNVPVWGIYITTPEVSVEKSKVSALITVRNTGQQKAGYRIRNTIISPDSKEAATTVAGSQLEAGEEKVTEQLFIITSPELWSTETPHLYKLRTEIITDSGVIDYLETVFGIRSLNFSPGNGFLLNGRSVILRGACIHHDNGALGSAAIDRADQRRVEILKKCGFNAIRTSHNPPSEGFLDACDRLGMLVMDEAFDMWTEPKRPDDYHLYFPEWHSQDLRSMVLRDRNHPSIILWSIGNEIKERADPIGLKIGKELIGTIKELDATRPVTMAICEFWETRGRKWEDSAPAFAQLDICGYNYVWGEYEKDHQEFPERVMAGTESFGLDIYENWRMATEKPYVIGDFVWTGLDYLGEAGIGQAMIDSVPMCWPWIISNCGDIDITGQKKPQALYRDIVWDRSRIEMAVEEIPPQGKEWIIRAWGWPRVMPSWNWRGNEGKMMRVFVYTKCDEVTLELNGKEIASQSAKPDSKFTFVFSVPYEPGELKALAVSGGKIIAEKSLVTTGPAARIKIIPDRPVITCNRNDLAYLTAELTDTDGRIVNDDSSLVRFKVEGNARLVAVDNGNPREPRSFQCDSCYAYHGRCIAILRPVGKRGKITLTASCSNTNSGKCVIEIN